MNGIIWTMNYDKGMEQLEKISKNYGSCGIKSVRKFYPSKGIAWNEFENGDVWRVVKIGENARGYKANISYIDMEAPLELIRKIILPATATSKPFAAFNYF